MSAKRERIQPDKLHVRKDGDKVLYSQVMVVEVGGTRQIFVAGQTPRDRDGNCVGKGDMRAQIEQVGENIKAALEAAGATLADIVKTTTYVTDMDEYFKHQDMRMRYFARCAADQHHRAGGAAVAAGVHGRDRGVRDRLSLRCSCPRRAGIASDPASGLRLLGHRRLRRNATADARDAARA